MISSELTRWYVESLTGSPDTVMDWRCIHDKERGKQGIPLRGSLNEVLPKLIEHNDNGYGIFAAINQLDGQGRELANVQHIRTHVVDLDNPLSSAAMFQMASTSGSFAVQSSPGKYHVYWKVQQYTGNDFYTLIQRKLAQMFDGDKSIIDATRIMRVPGFLHQKSNPFLVTGSNLTGAIYTVEQIEEMVAAVNIVEHTSTRSPLGEPTMQAPSLEWLRFAMNLLNPNEMDRSEWLSISAAIKQSGWNLADNETLYNMWLGWCAQYSDNDDGENRKLWNSIKDTEVGWSSIERRCPVKAYMDFGVKDVPEPQQTSAEVDTSSEILSPVECKEYFKDCYFVERVGQIFSKSGRFMNATQFNGRYGGKHFIITSSGKTCDEPWKAALRSTCWTIPKVDHVRFLPGRPTFDIVEDSLGRRGLNTFIPARIEAVPGDMTVFHDWMKRVLPDEEDRRLLYEYLAHCAKYPGYKIPWAILLQSAEGIGKTIFREIMQHALGDMYVYSPKAPELVKSGSTFNAWMRGKLLIVVDEIKIDERRELIEILKPMITDERVEIQSKGVDQDMEDNPANWLFFSNYKDAIPISQNGRRYSIFYSALQSKQDIENAGMDKAFFDKIWKWLRDEGGLQAITHWLLNYPIEEGGLPVRAPETSSHEEALNISRSPMEVVISDCIEDGVPGFKGGYISVLAVIAKCKASGIRAPNTRTAQTCLEQMGFVSLGRAPRCYIQEDVNNRTELYGSQSGLNVEDYGKIQGYE